MLMNKRKILALVAILSALVLASCTGNPSNGETATETNNEEVSIETSSETETETEADGTASSETEEDGDASFDTANGFAGEEDAFDVSGS